MSRKPPLSDEDHFPHAGEEPEHEKSEGGEAIKAAKELAEAKERWAPNARQIGMGAAIGVGSAAIVAGLIYWRGGRR